jgi:hypothetical protein
MIVFFFCSAKIGFIFQREKSKGQCRYNKLAAPCLNGNISNVKNSYFNPVFQCKPRSEDGRRMVGGMSEDKSVKKVENSGFYIVKTGDTSHKVFVRCQIATEEVLFMLLHGIKMNTADNEKRNVIVSRAG